MIRIYLLNPDTLIESTYDTKSIDFTDMFTISFFYKGEHIKRDKQHIIYLEIAKDD